MDSQQELIRLIEEQIGIEKESAAKLVETEKKVGTASAKVLLAEIRMDSQKHAGVLEAIRDCLKEDPSPKSHWQRAFGVFVDPIIVKREIESHKALGKSMQTHLHREMARTKDQTLLSLLGHLVQDEIRHMQTLDTIARECDRMIR